MATVVFENKNETVEISWTRFIIVRVKVLIKKDTICVCENDMVKKGLKSEINKIKAVVLNFVMNLLIIIGEVRPWVDGFAFIQGKLI